VGGGVLVGVGGGGLWGFVFFLLGLGGGGFWGWGGGGLGGGWGGFNGGPKKKFADKFFFIGLTSFKGKKWREGKICPYSSKAKPKRRSQGKG